MKKSWLVVFCFVLLSGFVAACSDSQRIMRLSSSSNAHGEVWNGGAYGVQICYDEIYDLDYQGAGPHTCTGSNKVVGLSSSTNAHAQKPSLNNYATNVCYGDLICSKRTASFQGGLFPRQRASMRQPAVAMWSTRTSGGGSVRNTRRPSERRLLPLTR